jgi:hypothetical protein
MALAEQAATPVYPVLVVVVAAVLLVYMSG